MMDLLRRHLFFIIAGIVGAAGIALGAIGLTSMEEVQSEMNQAVSLHRSLQSQQAVNQEGIEKQRERVEKITDQYAKVMDYVDRYSEHEQLIEGFFPNPSLDQQYQFPEAYKAKLLELYRRLDAGTTPTETDVLDAMERIKEEQALGEFGLDPKEPEGPPSDEEEPEPNPSGLITEEMAKTDPQVRASIAKARNIRCYAVPPTAGPEESSLDIVRNAYYVTGSPPDVLTCWEAQLTLWVQEDVINALASLNDRKAQQLEANEVRPWVGNLPVKELKSIRVSYYVFPNQESPTIVGTVPDASFTGNATTDEYEVVHFRLNLVVDSRDLPEIIATICNNSFTTLFEIDYRKVPPNLDMVGKIYGGEPVVDVEMVFEKILFSKFYLPIMPDGVLNDLQKQRPEPEEPAGPAGA